MKKVNQNTRDLLELLRFYRIKQFRTPKDFSINNLIESNLEQSYVDQLKKETDIRSKYNATLDHSINLLKMSIPSLAFRKRKQYERVLELNTQMQHSIRNQIDKEDVKSNRLKKEFEKIEKGINKRVK